MNTSSHSNESPNRIQPQNAVDSVPSTKSQVQELVAEPHARRFWVIFIILLVFLVIVSGGAFFLLKSETHQSTNDAYIEGRVIRISPKISGQVIALHVDDNDTVKAGDVLLEIDPADYQAKVDQATAAVAVAESAVEQARAAIARNEASVGQSQAAAKAAAIEAKRRASDYRRYSAMGTDGISEQQLESAKDASEAADDQRDAADKLVVAADAELKVARTNVDAAVSQVAAAKAQLRFAELQLQYTKVVAPESGTITRKAVECGAFVTAAQPLVSIVPSDRWVIANFKEVQFERMHSGQPVEITVDSLPGQTFHGHIQSLQSGTGSRFQLLPPENATGNWVKVVQRLPVKILFQPDQPGVGHLALGVSVEVTVDTRKRAVQPVEQADAND